MKTFNFNKVFRNILFHREKCIEFTRFILCLIHNIDRELMKMEWIATKNSRFEWKGHSFSFKQNLFCSNKFSKNFFFLGY